MTDALVNTENTTALETREEQMVVDAEEAAVTTDAEQVDQANESEESEAEDDEGEESEESEQSVGDPIHTPQRIRRTPEQPPPVVRRLFREFTDYEKDIQQCYVTWAQNIWAAFQVRGLHLILLGMLLAHSWPRSVHLVLGLLLFLSPISLWTQYTKQHFQMLIHGDVGEILTLGAIHASWMGIGYILIRAV